MPEKCLNTTESTHTWRRRRRRRRRRVTHIVASDSVGLNRCMVVNRLTDLSTRVAYPQK